MFGCRNKIVDDEHASPFGRPRVTKQPISRSDVNPPLWGTGRMFEWPLRVAVRPAALSGLQHLEALQPRSLTATASISTIRSGCDSRRTSTVVLAGRPTPKKSWRMSTCLKNSSMSVTNVVVFTRLASVTPAASSAARIFSPTWRICARMSRGPTMFPDLSRASCPEMKMSDWVSATTTCVYRTRPSSARWNSVFGWILVTDMAGVLLRLLRPPLPFSKITADVAKEVEHAHDIRCWFRATVEAPAAAGRRGRICWRFNERTARRLCCSGDDPLCNGRRDRAERDGDDHLSRLLEGERPQELRKIVHARNDLHAWYARGGHTAGIRASGPWDACIFDLRDRDCKKCRCRRAFDHLRQLSGRSRRQREQHVLCASGLADQDGRGSQGQKSRHQCLWFCRRSRPTRRFEEEGPRSEARRADRRNQLPEHGGGDTGKARRLRRSRYSVPRRRKPQGRFAAVVHRRRCVRPVLRYLPGGPHGIPESECGCCAWVPRRLCCRAQLVL